MIEPFTIDQMDELARYVRGMRYYDMGDLYDPPLTYTIDSREIPDYDASRLWCSTALPSEYYLLKPKDVAGLFNGGLFNGVIEGKRQEDREEIWESKELDEFLGEFERRGGGGDRV